MQEDLRVTQLCCVREFRAPFDPSVVIAEICATLRAYGLSTVTGDRYGGEFPVEVFRNNGVTYEASEKSKSDLYRDALPLLNSGRAELLDNKRLIAQICSLERRVARGGRDSIDHPPNAHDDVANSALAALVLASGMTGTFNLFNYFLAYGDYPDRTELSKMPPDERAKWIEKIHQDMRRQ